MKKIIEIEKVIKEEEIVKISCDFCTKESTTPLSSDITSFSIEPGYGSKFDSESFDFDICDKCLEKIFLNKLLNS